MTDLSLRQFTIALVGLCFFYLGFEFWFDQYAMISVDEFWFAHRIFQYRDGIPYRDFSPYKTVLGYYVLLLPMSLSANFITTLIFTKNVIALINAGIFALAGCWLARFFSRVSVLCSFVLLLSMDITLSYSSNIRVDLFAYWFCLFSLLCLLDKRFIWAGLLLGLGFCTSQKAIWYWFASNASLGTHWLFAARDKRYFIGIIKFNSAILATIMGYLVLWSCIAGWHVVMDSVFMEAAAMYQLDWYDASRLHYWRVILTFNPLAFLLWPLTIISLLVTFSTDEQYANRRFLIIYSFSILFCLLAYKQVFPYYMQVTLPIFLILYTAFFDWLIALSATPSLRWVAYDKFGGPLILSYILVTSGTIWLLELPMAYLLINICPLLILLRLEASLSAATFRRLLTINLIFIGVIYPFAIYTQKLMTLDSHYQKANLIAMNTLLQDGSDYTAGIELIYTKTQPIAGLRHLMGPAISYLYSPTEKLKPVMTAALYEDPKVTPQSINQALAHSRVKFYVNNYRMNSLPPSITNYLNQHYQHYWGSIYLYAPAIHAGTQQTFIQLSGRYKIQTGDKNPVTINGITYSNAAILSLPAEKIVTKAKASFRLALIPDEPELVLDPAFKRDEWEKIIF